MSSQKPQIEEGQTTQWAKKEKDTQSYTNHYTEN